MRESTSTEEVETSHTACHGEPRHCALTAILSAALLSLAIASGCASVRVTHDYDPDADFAGLKTWQWSEKPRALTGDVRVDDNSLLEGRVHVAVEAVLAEKGYSKLGSGEPDFLVTYHAAIAEKIDVQTVNDYYGYDPAWGWGYQPAGWGTRTYVNQYEEGSLMLDVATPNNHLIWRGTAAADVDESKTPEERAERILTSVEKMLTLFPPEQSADAK
jgi:hypothetical protein